MFPLKIPQQADKLTLLDICFRWLRLLRQNFSLYNMYIHAVTFYSTLSCTLFWSGCKYSTLFNDHRTPVTPQTTRVTQHHGAGGWGWYEDQVCIYYCHHSNNISMQGWFSSLHPLSVSSGVSYTINGEKKEHIGLSSLNGLCFLTSVNNLLKKMK